MKKTTHPEDLKAALRKRGYSLAAIATDLSVSRQAVSAVVWGKEKSRRITEAITQILEEQYE